MPKESQLQSRKSSQGSAASSLPIVEMAHVHLAFGEKVILKDLSLTLAPRERLVIMGQSGSGRISTLRIILGILHPSSAPAPALFSAN